MYPNYFLNTLKYILDIINIIYGCRPSLLQYPQYCNTVLLTSQLQGMISNSHNRYAHVFAAHLFLFFWFPRNLKNVQLWVKCHTRHCDSETQDFQPGQRCLRPVLCL